MKRLLGASLCLFLTSSILAGCGDTVVETHEEIKSAAVNDKEISSKLNEAQKEIVARISSGETKKLIEEVREGKININKDALKHYFEKKIFKTPDDFVKSLLGMYGEKSDHESIIIINSLFSDDFGSAVNVRKSNHISEKTISNIKHKMLYRCGELCEKYPLSSAVIFGMIGDQAILSGNYKTAYVAYAKEAIFSANSKTPLASDVYAILDYFGCHEDRDGWAQLVSGKDQALDGLKGNKYRPIKDYDYTRVTKMRASRDPLINKNIMGTVSFEEKLQYNCPLSQNFFN